ASLDPSEIHAVALDVLLARLLRARGLAVFQRAPGLGSEDVVFRGFTEAEADRLRPLLVGEKAPEAGQLAQPEIATAGPLHDALCAAGLPREPLLLVPVHGRAAEGGLLVVPEDERPFRPEALEIARLVATHAQVAVHNAERYHQAKERAFVDDVP